MRVVTVVRIAVICDFCYGSVEQNVYLAFVATGSRKRRIKVSVNTPSITTLSVTF